jgi:hypothetical protein
MLVRLEPSARDIYFAALVLELSNGKRGMSTGTPSIRSVDKGMTADWSLLCLAAPTGAKCPF